MGRRQWRQPLKLPTGFLQIIRGARLTALDLQNTDRTGANPPGEAPLHTHSTIGVLDPSFPHLSFRLITKLGGQFKLLAIEVYR